MSLSSAKAQGVTGYHTGWETGTMEGFVVEQNAPVWPPDFQIATVDSQTSHSGSYSIYVQIRYGQSTGDGFWHYGVGTDMSRAPVSLKESASFAVWFYREYEAFVDDKHVTYYGVDVSFDVKMTERVLHVHYLFNIFGNITLPHNIDNVYVQVREKGAEARLRVWTLIQGNISADVKQFVGSPGPLGAGFEIIGVHLWSLWSGVSVITGANGIERPEAKLRFDDFAIGPIIPVGPSDSAVLPSQSVLLQVLAQGPPTIAKLDAFVDNNTSHLSFNTGTGYWEATVRVSEGRHRWYSVVWGVEGWSLTSEQAIFTVDLSPPRIEIVSPGQGEVLGQHVVLVSGSSWDSLSAVAKVEVSLDGGSWQPANGTQQWNYSLELADGRHTVAARAFDLAGNIETKTVDFLVDTTPPTIFANRLKEPFKGIVLVSGSSWDSLSAVAKVEVSLDGGSWQPANGTQQWNYTLNTTSLSDGQHQIRVRALDFAGNPSIQYSYQFLLDREPPSLQVLQEPSNANSFTNVTIRVTAYDRVSAVKYVAVRYSLDNSSSWSELMVAKSADTYVTSIPRQTGGTLVLYEVASEDNSGNTISERFSYSVVPDRVLSVHATVAGVKSANVAIRVSSADLPSQIAVTSVTSQDGMSKFLLPPGVLYEISATWQNYTQSARIQLDSDTSINLDFFKLSTSSTLDLPRQFTAWGFATYDVDTVVRLDLGLFNSTSRSYTLTIAGIDAISDLPQGVTASNVERKYVIVIPEGLRSISFKAESHILGDSRFFRNYYGLSFPVFTLDGQGLQPIWDTTITLPQGSRIVNMYAVDAIVSVLTKDGRTVVYYEPQTSLAAYNGLSYDDPAMLAVYSLSILALVAFLFVTFSPRGLRRFPIGFMSHFRGMFTYPTNPGGILAAFILTALAMMTFSNTIGPNGFHLFNASPKILNEVVAIETVLSFVLIFLGSSLALMLISSYERRSPFPLILGAVVGFLVFEIISWVFYYTGSVLGIPLGYHGGQEELTGAYLLGFVGGGNVPRLLAGIAGVIFGIIIESKAGRLEMDIKLFSVTLAAMAFAVFLPKIGQVIYETAYIFVGGETYGFKYGAAIDWIFTTMAQVYKLDPGSRGIIMWIMAATALPVATRLRKTANSFFLALILPLLARGLMRTGQTEYIPLTFQSIFSGISLGFLTGILVLGLAWIMSSRQMSTLRKRVYAYAMKIRKRRLCFVALVGAFMSLFLFQFVQNLVSDLAALVLFFYGAFGLITETGEGGHPGMSGRRAKNFPRGLSSLGKRLTNYRFYLLSLPIVALAYVVSRPVVGTEFSLLLAYAAYFVLPGYLVAKLLPPLRSARLGGLLILSLTISASIYPVLNLLSDERKFLFGAIAVSSVCSALLYLEGFRRERRLRSAERVRTQP